MLAEPRVLANFCLREIEYGFGRGSRAVEAIGSRRLSNSFLLLPNAVECLDTSDVSGRLEARQLRDQQLDGGIRK